jgi:DNA (cytosine-5)-methyltransferase 1
VAQVASSSGGRRGHLARGEGGTDPELNGSALSEQSPVPDLLCGGFPCQDLSVAGRRAGLAGERSGLFFEFARVAESVRPRRLLIENVPGLFSSNGGRDFGVVLATLAELGYGLAWRILDSRFFGVPQRRRRVFIVGALANGDPRAAAERAAEVLAVGSRCRRHSPAGAEAEQGAAHVLADGSGSRVSRPLGSLADGGYRTTDLDGVPAFVSRALNTKGDRQDATVDIFVSHALTSEGHDASEDGTGRGTPIIAAPLSHGSNPNSNMAGRRREDDENLVAFVSENQRAEVLETPYARQLTSGGGKPGQGYPMMRDGATVRRLTPTECERLQGFPDGWTDVEWEGKPAADSRRYAALGDAVTVPVAEWIGHQLMRHLKARAAA